MELMVGAVGCGARVLFCGWGVPEGTWSAGIEALIAAGRFQNETSQIKLLEDGGQMLILLGRPEAEDMRHVKQLIGRAVRMARDEKAGSLEIDLDTWQGTMGVEPLVRAAAQAAWEGGYVFDTYRSARSPGLDRICITCAGAESETVQRAFAEGELLGQAVVWARDAVNRTSRDMTPQKLTECILALTAEDPCQAEVLDEEALREAGAEALLNVSAGSEAPPRMVILRYHGDAAHPDRVTALLGKGVTYDSGGLALKSKSGMLTMHHDMGGAAAAAAAFHAAVRMGVRLNLTAVLPICENMLSPAGYRQGDIIGTMNGKSVLIKSTDAEGRLVLADAMTWAIRREKAERLVDIATLTGGAVSAYGPLINAVAVEDETLRTAVKAASASSGELVWEMPLLDDYLTYIKAEHADLANTSAGAGPAMINAALFLRAFTESRPWLHIDSAGTSWTDKTAGCFSSGATGAGTVLLYDLICRLADQGGPT